jgi:hypothetical protein
VLGSLSSFEEATQGSARVFETNQTAREGAAEGASGSTANLGAQFGPWGGEPLSAAVGKRDDCKPEIFRKPRRAECGVEDTLDFYCWPRASAAEQNRLCERLVYARFPAPCQRIGAP